MRLDPTTIHTNFQQLDANNSFCMQITSSLSITVYVEDVNDHAPIFKGAPYKLVVDELTPVGKFKGFIFQWKYNCRS